MTIQEAIRSAIESAGDNWFRPASWRGCGQAFALKDGFAEVVPGPRGGTPGMTHDIEDLLGEWEVVSVDGVLTERSI